MALRVLLVDDEPLARSRLRALLAECALPPGTEVGEAANAAQAQTSMAQRPWDVVLLDIHMPGLDGMALAAQWRDHGAPPAVVFVTAHPEHALQAFEVEAVDYLTKPVRRERLLQALEKAQRALAQRAKPVAPADYLLIHDRGRVERVPVRDVVYLKAELKYVTVRTPERSYIYDGSLHDLERHHSGLWLRVHRNALAAKGRIRALERATVGEALGDESEGWWLTLDGVNERLTVSRRQLSAVREAMAGRSAV